MTNKISDLSSTLTPSSNRSKLAPHLSDICELKDKGYSYNQIATLLFDAYNLKTTGAKIWEYLGRVKKRGANLWISQASLKESITNHSLQDNNQSQTVQHAMYALYESKQSTSQSNIHSNQGFDMQNKALDDKSITLERFLNNRPQPITQGEQLK